MCLQHPIEPDHLGSPRKVIDPSRGTALWDWPILGNAFGTAAANDDPDGDGNATTLNLRFPGQHYDAATGLHYNYFRDYDPATGRYVESDPIGLQGGVSTFGYVGQSPMLWIDWFGLAQKCVSVPVPGKAAVDESGHYYGTYTGYQRHCYDVPDPAPMETCAYGNCTCYQRCVNQETFFGLGGSENREVGAVGMNVVGVVGGTAGAVAGGATTGIVAVTSTTCAAISVGVGMFELTARLRCAVVCEVSPTYY